MSSIRRRHLCLLLAAACVALPAGAAQPEADSVALTIYSTAAPGAVSPELYRPAGGRGYAQRVPGYAVIKQERQIELSGARSEVRFSDVAALIDPTTVSFTSLTDPNDTRVLEQNYQFDLVSTEKLMQRYLERELTIEQAHGDQISSVEGTLLSTAGGIVLRGKDGAIQIFNGYSSAKFPELPGGLISKPTLVWDVATKKPGWHQVRVTYQTEGITWWADYNVVFTEGKDANSGLLDLGAWVSILNQSGATYPDARLKLIAGDVQRAQPPSPARSRMDMVMEEAEAPLAKGFEEKAFFEFHLYTLGRPTTLPDNSTKQIELFPAPRGVPCEKLLVYYGLEPGFRGVFPDPVTDRAYGTASNKKVDVYLRFKNAKEVGLGMPLPRGRLRVNKLDSADGTLEFIGEDTIDHTPKDEQVQIRLGSAFDVVGERRQVDFKVDVARKWLDEEIEIKLRNHKEKPVRVLVKENLYRWTNWEIRAKTHAFQKLDARTIEFPVELKKDAEETIRYTVHYSW